MEQQERAVLDPSEGSTEQGGDAPAAVRAGDVTRAEEEGDQDRVSETDNSVRATAPEGSTKQDLEVTDGDSARWATRKTESEDREDIEDTSATTHFEFRATAAEAAPPSASIRVWSRGRKQGGLAEFVGAVHAEGTWSNHVRGASSSSSGLVTGTHEHVSAMPDNGQGAAPGDDMKLKRACSAPGATVAIAHASQPDSYRRMPWRSRKQYTPKRNVAAAGALTSAAASPAGDLPLPAASLGRALSSASGLLRGTRATTASSRVFDASASSSSSSNRPPSRGRKQPRPEHFIPEEAEATASAKARRSDIVLDRFLSSLVHGSSASDSEWVRNVTAEDAAVSGQHQPTREGFRIKDARRYAARALSRLGCASPSSAAAAPAEPDGRGRFYGVLAVLGASLALSVVSCVLFYIAGQRSDASPSAEKPDE